MQLTGVVALVTGSSSGLGASVARALASAGAQVLVHGRDSARANGVAGAIEGTVVLGDLTRPDQIDDIARQALAVDGHVDLLVNNAGQGWAGPFTEMTNLDIDRLVALNLTAPILLTQALLPQMLCRQTGHVCFISSVTGRTSVAGESVYAATKAGLDGFADSLRLETIGTGVGVSVAVPAVIDTPFFARRGQAYNRGRPRPVPATQVASAVVHMIEQDAAEIWTPRWLRAVGVARHTAPRAYRGLAARFGEQIRVAPPDPR
ncbi:SDR family NAD(P)-dependent oxidoreductase [Leekyejoonella antrihumi]|uniref:SDR family NAD(P)-dependent oxidoreductase n=1 Tax=Leekyejoonella antrihumi TaxID=1660198 RepID=A0A563E625_9MICO|nr:SDR family oxidoreductase [Leekyejoonella antrihumi]TWP37672.1 SDR family NAD(P)-dependent oxidoreductase [Leekyejoonella antrihumi]